MGGLFGWRDPADITVLGVLLRVLVALALPPSLLMALWRLAPLYGPRLKPLFDGMSPALAFWFGQALLLLCGLVLYVPGIVAVAPLHRSLWGAVTFAVFYLLAVTALILGASLYVGGV